ncbi:MAG: ABC transporter substrate-binding protein, partial [Anaerolineaceae bacterium]
MVVLMLGVAACTPVSQTANTVIPAKSPTGSSAPTATTVPPKVLNICIAEEPVSLYRYDGRNSTVKESVFAALYDGPFEVDPTSGDYAVSILETYPSLENGGVLLLSTAVQAGDVVVDAYGNLTVFKKDLLVRPAGCSESACAVTWEGSGEFSMDQMTAEFTFLPETKWSDGEALTAGDSVYSHQLAEGSGDPDQLWALERTAEYNAKGDRVVTWRGVPGFTASTVKAFFWMPMPAHLLAELPADEVAGVEAAAHLPIGWGAYRITERETGEALHFEKNPNYFRGGEGLPAFDRLNYLIVPDREQALQMLQAGECDLLDGSYGMESLDKAALTELDQTAELHIENWELVEQLVFGISPASYDDGHSAWTEDRTDFFGDLRTRQAVAACLDTPSLAEELLRARLPDSVTLPVFLSEAAALDGNLALDEAGWVRSAE